MVRLRYPAFETSLIFNFWSVVSIILDLRLGERLVNIMLLYSRMSFLFFLKQKLEIDRGGGNSMNIIKKLAKSRIPETITISSMNLPI